MNISVIDFETHNWCDIYAVGYYNGERFLNKYNKDHDQNDVISSLFEWLEKYNSGATIYAHNGGKFDFLPLLQYMDEYEMPYKINTMIHGRITELTVKTFKGKRGTLKNPKTLFKFRDSFTLLPSSLDSLTSSRGFDVEHKKLKANYDDFVPVEYLKNDCMGLYEVIKKFETLYVNHGGKEKLPLTISGAASYLYWHNYNTKNKHTLIHLQKEQEKKVRLSYYGGRTEIFKTFGEELYYYDFNSLYPSVMLNMEYPCGTVWHTKHYDNYNLGIYRIRWTSPDLYIPLLPYRSDTGKLLFPNGEELVGWYTSAEIDKALELGYEIEVIDGYVWEDKKFIFNEYVDEWYNIKKKSKGALRQVSKLLLNSLYGKFAQRRMKTQVLNDHDYAKLTDEEHNEIDIVHDSFPFVAYKEYEDWNNHQIVPQISSFVSSYARVKLYNTLEELGKKVYYCDTDSVITSKRLETSNEIGALKEEIEEGSSTPTIEKGYFVLPKIYALKFNKPHKTMGRYIMKAKGFKNNTEKDPSMLTLPMYQQAVFEGDYTMFEQKYAKVLGFKESFKRHAKRFSTKEFTKNIISHYDKRTVTDMYCTEPLRLNGVG